MSASELPLFPLRVVLYPGAHLPLRIFERRYLDLVRDCARTDSGFGVCLVMDDDDGPAGHARIGTLAKIRDWYTLEDGLLGITAEGGARFAVRETRARDNGLLIGAVDWLGEPPRVTVPEEFAVLSQVAGRFIEQLGEHYPDHHPDDLQDAAWVGYRLAEWLPLEPAEKQALLELNDPLERLRALLGILPRFQAA